MIFEMIFQVKDVVNHIPESASTATMVTVAFGVMKLLDRRMGRKKDLTITAVINRAKNDILEKLDPVERAVERLTWQVEGTNGHGGLVNDIENLRKQLDRFDRRSFQDDSHHRRDSK